MNVGKLDKKITIRAAIQTANDFGELAGSFADVYTGIYANVEFTANDEKETADQRFSSSTAVFTVRKSSSTINVNVQNRIKYNSLEYDIESVVPDEAGRFIQITGKYRGGK